MANDDRPQSALNLRLALALFGLVCTGVLLFLAFRYGSLAIAIGSCVLLAITITDLVAIVIRRRRRKRREPPGATHSIFE